MENDFSRSDPLLFKHHKHGFPFPSIGELNYRKSLRCIRGFGIVRKQYNNLLDKNRELNDETTLSQNLY